MKIYFCCDSGVVKIVVVAENESAKATNDWNLTSLSNLPFVINPEMELDIITEEEIEELIVKGGYEEGHNSEMGNDDKKIFGAFFRNGEGNLLYVIEVLTL